MASRQLLQPTAQGQGQGPQRRWPGPVTGAQQRPSTPRVLPTTGPDNTKRTNPQFANSPRSPKPAAVNHRPAFTANPRLAHPARVSKPAAPALRAAFKTAACAQTLPAPKPARKKTTTRGGKGGPFSADAIAGDYLKLCRDPFSDLQQWIDEDKKIDNKIPVTSSHGQRHDRHAARTATSQHLLRQTLHEVSSRVDKIDKPRGDRGDLPAQSGAGSRQHHGLQQVQADRNLSDPTHASAEGPVADSGEISGICGYYAALIAAARNSLSPRDAAALIRNLKNQKIIAVRAAKDRRHGARANRQKFRPTRPTFAPSQLG